MASVLNWPAEHQDDHPSALVDVLPGEPRLSPDLAERTEGEGTKLGRGYVGVTSNHGGQGGQATRGDHGSGPF